MTGTLSRAERGKLFMKAYEEAARAYKIVVTSCGCCDGPELMDMVQRPSKYPPGVWPPEGYLDANIKHLKEGEEEDRSL
jgi:hypothetical protein